MHVVRCVHTAQLCSSLARRSPRLAPRTPSSPASAPRWPCRRATHRSPTPPPRRMQPVRHPSHRRQPLFAPHVLPWTARFHCRARTPMRQQGHYRCRCRLFNCSTALVLQMHWMLLRLVCVLPARRHWMRMSRYQVHRFPFRRMAALLACRRRRRCCCRRGHAAAPHGTFASHSTTASPRAGRQRTRRLRRRSRLAARFASAVVTAPRERAAPPQRLGRLRLGHRSPLRSLV